MPYPHPFARQSILWDLPGGEKASCNLGWTSATGPVDDSDVVDMLEQKALDLWDDIKGAFTNQVNMVGSTIRTYGTDGLIDTTYERAHAPVPGITGGACLPTEVAVVASLLTSVAGRSTRGRVYLPPMSSEALTSTGRVGEVYRDAVAAGFAVYCTPDTVGGELYYPVVISPTLQLLTEIDHGRVGDVFDAQRRRRDSLIEQYSIWPA